MATKTTVKLTAESLAHLKLAALLKLAEEKDVPVPSAIKGDKAKVIRRILKAKKVAEETEEESSPRRRRSPRTRPTATSGAPAKAPAAMRSTRCSSRPPASP